MERTTRGALAAALLCAALAAGDARAHVTPPVPLVAEPEAVAELLAGAEKHAVRDLRLSGEERAAVKRATRWTPGRDVRVHVGRDAGGKLVGSVVCLTEHLSHGSIRMAVGLGPDGRITGARVLEVSEETLPWIRELLDHDFARDYVGRDARAEFGLSDRLRREVTGRMPRFYGEVLASMLHRAAVLFEVGFLGEAAPERT